MIDRFRLLQKRIENKIFKPIPKDVMFLFICYFAGLVFAWTNLNNIYTSDNYWFFIVAIICFFISPLVFITLFFPKKKE